MSDNLFESDDAGTLARVSSLAKQQRDASRMLDFASGASKSETEAVKRSVDAREVVIQGEVIFEARRGGGFERVKPSRRKSQRFDNVSDRPIRERPFPWRDTEVHPIPVSRLPRADGSLSGVLEPRCPSCGRGDVTKPPREVRYLRRGKEVRKAR